VGVVQLPTLTVRVTPKFPVSRVLFLWSYSLNPKHWRDEQAPFKEARELVEAMAHAFVSALERALRRGVLHGYRLTEESAKTVRGRILLREQWANSLRLRSEVAVAYDEFTPDILENRLLKAAIERIRRIRIANEPIRLALGRYARLLGDVSDQNYAAGRIPEVHFTHLNRHYERAIFFAHMILSAMSFDLGDGSVRARGFIINMNRVFEEFVRVALGEALHEPASRFGTWRELYGGKVQRLYFHEAYRKELEPDLLWAPDGVLRFVGDAKYKRIVADNMPNADLYQMLAYIVAADLPNGLLIYPKGEAEETMLRVAKLRRTIETRTLDISAEPRDILASVAQIADRVRAMGKCSMNPER
jgi:5-methylcytosine-specific restriction enzyme subunit McrC